MNINDFDLDYKKKLALAQLAAGKTIQVAAKESNLSAPTISKLKNSEAGKKLLKEAVSQLYDASIAELSIGAMEADLEQPIRD